MKRLPLLLLLLASAALADRVNVQKFETTGSTGQCFVRDTSGGAGGGAWGTCSVGTGLVDGDYGDITVSGSGSALSIDANAVTEADLKCVNVATDEYCLTYESTTGDFEWHPCVIDADKGDITVSSNGTNWQIDADSVTATEIATNAVGTTEISNGAVGNADLRNSAGYSVIGRSASSTGGVADITATAQGQVLQRGASSIGWGSIDLADSDAVGVSVLATANGGTGVATPSDDFVLVGNGTIWQQKSVPDCDATGAQALNYDTTLNSFACGSIVVSIGDGDKGDITVSGGGGSWQIDADAVGASEIATDGVGSAEIAAGAVGTSEIANGSVAAADLAATSDDTIYVSSGAAQVSTALPDCDAVGSVLTYDTGTNAFACAARVVTAYKATTETVTSSTTLQDDDALVLTLASSSKYIVTGSVFVAVESATPGFAAEIVAGTATLAALDLSGVMHDSTTIVTALVPDGTNLFDFGDALGGPGEHLLTISGTISVTTGGTVKFRWAQDTSSADDTQVRRGSFLRAELLP